MDEKLLELVQQLAEGQSQLQQIQVAQAELAEGRRAPAGTPVVPPMYGRQGLFGHCDDRTIINASVTDLGISRWLSWYPSIYRNFPVPVLAYASQDPDESNQNYPCDDCPSPQFGGCSMDFCFGRVCVETPELQADEMGVMPCQAHPIRRLYGRVPGKDGGAQYTTIGRDDEWAMVMAGAALVQYHSRMMWNGDPGTNNSAGGGYQEFYGFDILVNTGLLDVYTGATCDSLDSVVIAFNNQYVCDTGTANQYNIYEYLVAVIRTIQYRAEMGIGTRITPSDMLIVSAPEIIDCIIDCIACTYYPCLAGVGSTALQISADAAARFRDRMISEGVLHIDGVDIPYMRDPWVTKTTGLAFGDETCADVFVLTRRVGAQEVLYGQFQDFREAPGRRMFGVDQGENLFWSDGGRYLHTIEELKWCMTASTLLKARIILSAPWLQGRITDVCCRTPLHYPDPSPSSDYFLDGGHSSPFGKALYSACGDVDLSD